MYCGAAEICHGPSTRDAIFNVSLEKIALRQEVSVEDQLLLLIGNQPAVIVGALRSSFTSITIMAIPPAVQNDAYVGGSSTSTFFVVSASTRRLIALSQYTYWASPRITKARFSSQGESIAVLFDSDTNRGGKLSVLDRTCSGILPDLSLVGSLPQCIWVSNKRLDIILGSGATITLGSPLQVSSIRSFNSISDVSSPMAFVQAPESPVLPSVYLKGPSIIDPCSPLELLAISSSPRPLMYSWSCSNVIVLNSILKNVYSNSIAFPKGTPSMQSVDKNYTILCRLLISLVLRAILSVCQSSKRALQFHF